MALPNPRPVVPARNCSAHARNAATRPAAVAMAAARWALCCAALPDRARELPPSVLRPETCQSAAGCLKGWTPAQPAEAAAERVAHQLRAVAAGKGTEMLADKIGSSINAKAGGRTRLRLL